MNSIEDKEAKAIKEEAAQDDASEMGHTTFELSGDLHVPSTNPFDNKEVQALLAEKDEMIYETDQIVKEKNEKIVELEQDKEDLDFQVHELIKLVNQGKVNTDQVLNHPTYKELKKELHDMVIDRDNLLVKNEELKETVRKLTKESFKPASEIKGSIGQ